MESGAVFIDRVLDEFVGVANRVADGAKVAAVAVVAEVNHVQT